MEMEYYVCKANIELSKIYFQEGNYETALDYLEKGSSDCCLYKDIEKECKDLRKSLMLCIALDKKLDLSLSLYKEKKILEAFEIICEIIRDSENFPLLYEDAIVIMTNMLREKI